MNDITNYCNEFFGGLTGKLGTDIKNLIMGVVLTLVLYFLYQFLKRLLKEREDKIHVDVNIKKIVKIVIKCIYIFFSVVFVASVVGIDTSSLIAAFSILGIAISLSVQQIMGNVANSFAIFINKPFKIGDHIKVNDMEGIVKSMSFVNTKIVTFDNELIIVPNNIMGNAVIYNYSLNDIRRVVIEVGITYKANSETVKSVINDALDKINGIIKENKVVVAIKNFADSSVIYTVRFYTHEEVFLTTKEAALEAIKKTLEMNGIEIPYPIRTVEIKNNQGK